MGDTDRTTAIVVTDRAGLIVEVTDSAAQLLNVTTRGLGRSPRSLIVFVDGNREAILAAQRLAGPETSAPLTVILRPRERPPRPVAVTVAEASDGFLEWTIQAHGQSQQGPHARGQAGRAPATHFGR